jgi:dihydroflavonol-4-reductase
MKNRPTTILIVGVFSFLGSHIAYQLIEQGYHVKGTMTMISEKNAIYEEELQEAVKGFPGSLQIFPLDVLNDENWTALLTDVEYVFYLAFPRIRCKGRDSKDLNMSISAVDGSRRVVQYCQRSKTVKKLIFTSCYFTLTEKFEPDKIYNESHWNITDTMQSDSYAYAKVRSEEIVTEFCSDSKCTFQFVSLLPGVMWGPSISKLFFCLYEDSLILFHLF